VVLLFLSLVALSLACAYNATPNCTAIMIASITVVDPCKRPP